MANTNIQITLSADSKQVKDELRILDQEMKSLGQKAGTGRIRDEEAGSRAKKQTPKRSGKEVQEGEETLSALEALVKEASLLRKELQNYNKKDVAVKENSGKSEVERPSEKPRKKEEDKDFISETLKNLVSAATLFKTATTAWNFVSSGAQASVQGEISAYGTYGSTLAYNDYYTAKKEAKELGVPYGYDYSTVMSIGSTNLETAGYTSLENYRSDVDSIMATSKAWGLDPSQLSRAAGTSTTLGITESGDQKKFADMLADSIVNVGMVGRESEQLRVLEGMSESLSRTLVSVDSDGLTNVMALYSSIASNNSTLKGDRGAAMVDTINSSIVNGGSTLDALLGWGTTYTGVEGKIELQKIKEQGLTNPETLQTIFKNFEATQGKSIDSEYGKLFLTSALGLSISQAEALLSSKDEIMSGTYSYKEGTGQAATVERQENYGSSGVSTEEQFGIEAQDTKEVAGNVLNDLLEPFKNFYSGLSDGGKLATNTAGLVAGGAATYGVGKVAVPAVSNVISSTLGLGKGASTASTSLAGLASGGSKLLKGASKAALPLAVGAEMVGTGIDVYSALNEGDGREATQEAIGGIGSTLGGFAGMKAGALAGTTVAPFLGPLAPLAPVVGGAVGWMGGSFLGNAAGEVAGEAIGRDFDASGLSPEDKATIEQMYLETKNLYEAQGNNAAQQYTISQVTPYLNSLGVSKSYTDKYNVDSGIPDFMKDYEGGLFESGSETEATVEQNTTELSKLNTNLVTLNNTLTSGSPASETSSSSFSLLNPTTWFSHATGNDYIPYDNYLASLHKGEMVLDKADADDYRQGYKKSSSGSTSLELNINLTGSVSGMTKENQDIILQSVVSKINSSDLEQLISTGFSRVQNY